jgi:ribose transport system substrate-binding protein
MEPDALPTAGKYPDRKRSYTIQSVVRAVSVLNSFSSTSEVLDLRVVAGRVRLNKGTTFAFWKLW